MSDLLAAVPDALVRVEERPDGVATVRLNHPPFNALSFALLDELARGAALLARTPSVKAIVLTGTEQAFSHGGDSTDFSGPDEATHGVGLIRAAFDALAAIPRPVLAAIGGAALGGGLELAMACDLRVAADSARLGQPEILLGIIPGGGGTQRLPRLVGPARAKEMIWSGRQLDAEEALAIGLVDRVVPVADLEAAALGWAASLAAGPAVAMGLAKQAIAGGLDRPLAAGLDLEREAFVAALATQDAAIGTHATRDG